jgi:hypothetical protein
MGASEKGDITKVLQAIITQRYGSTSTPPPPLPPFLLITFTTFKRVPIFEQYF